VLFLFCPLVDTLANSSDLRISISIPSALPLALIWAWLRDCGQAMMLFVLTFLTARSFP